MKNEEVCSRIFVVVVVVVFFGGGGGGGREGNFKIGGGGREETLKSTNCILPAANIPNN